MREAAEEEHTRFEELRSLGQREVEAGRFEEAEALYAEALGWAAEHGDEQQVDLALCNRAAVAIQLGRGEGELPRLREILVRNNDRVNCRLAAYHISIYYQFQKNYKKSRFYAKIACDRAELLGVREWLASSHNQLGNALLGESFVEEACGEYERALQLIAGDTGVGRALILHNLGYCRVLQRRYREGYSFLYECLSILRRLGGTRYQVLPRLDLCFAHLETGRYGHARRQALIALEMAEQTGQTDGEVDTARDYFSRLQQDYFPGATYLPGFLLAVDVRKLINLHA
jgi:tetratricopeptide (TPR) repeat protein